MLLDPSITRDFLNGEFGDLLGISDKAIQASEEKRTGPQRTTGEFLQVAGELPGPATPFFLIGYAPKLLKQLGSLGATGSTAVDKINKEIENILNKIDSGIAVLGSIVNDKPSIVIVVTDDLINKDIKAGELAKEIGASMGGGGGGKPNLATAGGKDKKSLELALSSSKKILEAIIEEADAV